MEIRPEKDLACLSVLLFLAFIIMPKITPGYVLKFALQVHGVFNLQDNALKILFCVELNGLITQRICV